MVTEPVFDFANDFSEGLASVRKNGKYGFIDKTGAMVIEPQYGYAGPFSEGLSHIRIYDKHGYIDKTGAIVIEPQFDYAYDFSEGRAIVGMDHKEGYIDKNGQFVIEPQYYDALSFEDGIALVDLDLDGLWGGIFDKNGKLLDSLFIPDYKDVIFGLSHEGLRRFVTKVKYGLAYPSGEHLTEAIYDYMELNDDGMFEYVLNGKRGLLDNKGNVVEDAELNQ
jgi:hypothetical protein